MPKLKVLHVALESEKAGVGGLKLALKGLLPALARNDDLEVSLVTPFFDIYEEFYNLTNVQLVARLEHVFKGKIFRSSVYRTINGVPHYLIRPVEHSPVAMIFDIKNQADMYKSFEWSEFQNRVEYFNSAVAAMVRLTTEHIPQFDVVHTHTWHAGLSICLIKEFSAQKRTLNKIPHCISSTYMLTEAEQGHLTTAASVQGLVTSLGLSDDFISSFPAAPYGFRADSLKQAALVLAYADSVTTAHAGDLQNFTTGHGFGLDALLVKLLEDNRLVQVVTPIIEAEDAVWDAGPAQQYSQLYNTLRSQEVLTVEQIRIVTEDSKPRPTCTWFYNSLKTAHQVLVDIEDSLCCMSRKDKRARI